MACGSKVIDLIQPGKETNLIKVGQLHHVPIEQSRIIRILSSPTFWKEQVAMKQCPATPHMLTFYLPTNTLRSRNLSHFIVLVGHSYPTQGIILCGPQKKMMWINLNHSC